MKSKVFFKAAAVGVVLLLALSLVTCDLLGIGPNDKEEDLDWEFVEQADGTAQLTLWLDGSKPVKATTNKRALNLSIAKRSHDFFEAVFITSGVVARSNWEIGQAAGIRGVPRGVNYVGVDPATIGTTGTGEGRAMVLVGRKFGTGEGTLLGVGFMTHVDSTLITSIGTGNAGGTIGTNTRNVTFTVSALDTKIGFDFSASDVKGSWGKHASNDTAPNGGPMRNTFLTAAAATGATKASIANVNFDNTMIGTAKFKEIATYTMFQLPVYDEDTAVDLNDPDPPEDWANVIAATYKVGGLTEADTKAGIAATSKLTGTVYSTGTVYPDGIDLSKGLFIADCDPEKNFQVIERLAMYQALGQTHDVIEAPLDTVTTVVPDSTYTFAAGDNFDPEIKLNFQVRELSGGAFAFTWQIPVFALAPDGSTSPGPFPATSTNGGPDGVYWYIRPAHGQQQFLLDDGRSAGGAVLMGVGVGDLDWLDIIVDGFGFSNKPLRPVTP